MDYDKIYEYGLPHHRRVYFDHIGDEYKSISQKQKLLDIGYLLTHGYDVRAEIHATYLEHSTVTEDNVRFSLDSLLEELTGDNAIGLMIKHENWTTDQIIDELFTRLLQRYNPPADPYTPHYLKSPKNMTTKEIKKINGWLKVMEEFHGNSPLFDLSGKEYIYPGDEKIIHEYNAKHKKESEHFVLNTIPNPWLGNPLKAKVIILSQNPGWVENAGRVIPLMLQHIPQIAEEIMEFFRSTFALQSSCFMPEDWNKSFGFSARDAYNVLGDWYWKKRLHFLVDEGLDEELIYDNLALIQYIPYSSIRYASLPQNVYLPSQEYTRKLIDFIRCNNTETIFVVPRAVDLWKRFLGDCWDALEKDKRIITHKEGVYRPQYISRNCLGDEGFERIVETFQDCKKQP